MQRSSKLSLVTVLNRFSWIPIDAKSILIDVIIDGKLIEIHRISNQGGVIVFVLDDLVKDMEYLDVQDSV